MASSGRTVWDNYPDLGREEFRKNKSVKRVSFLEDDMVVMIPSNDELDNANVFSTTIPRYRGPSRLSSSPSQNVTGITRVAPSGSFKSQTPRRFIRAGDHGSIRSNEKQVKSILKKSSTESSLQNSRFYDSYREECSIPTDDPSIKYKVGVDPEKLKIKTKLNSSFYVKNNEGFDGSDSYRDFLKRQKRRITESPQSSTAACFSKASFSPNRTLVQKHGSFTVAGPLKSTSPEEEYRKAEISKQIPSIVRNCKSDVLGVVGSMLNVSDLYPVVNNLQKKSLSSSDSNLSRHQGLGDRYVPARELISRNGNKTRTARNTTQMPANTLRSSNNLTQSNVSARVSSGLGRAAELSLLNRLRRIERNDPPYIAWQSSERSIHSSPHITTIPTRASSLTSVYGGSLMSGRISTVLEKTPSALRSPSSQYYY